MFYAKCVDMASFGDICGQKEENVCVLVFTPSCLIFVCIQAKELSFSNLDSSQIVVHSCE